MFLFFYLRLIQNLDLFGNNNRSFSFSFFCRFVSLFSATVFLAMFFEENVPDLDEDVYVFLFVSVTELGYNWV